MADHTTTDDADSGQESEPEWGIKQRGLDGNDVRGQVTLDGGIAKDHLRDGRRS